MEEGTCHRCVFDHGQHRVPTSRHTLGRGHRCVAGLLFAGGGSRYTLSHLLHLCIHVLHFRPGVTSYTVKGLDLRLTKQHVVPSFLFVLSFGLGLMMMLALAIDRE